MQKRVIVSLGLLCILAESYFIFKKYTLTSPYGSVIILNGPSGSGKSSIQKSFQYLMMPDLWCKVGIDNLFDKPFPDITPENIQPWLEPNPIRWIETTQDAEGNNVISLHLGDQGKKVAYAMNSAIASYVQNDCNLIVDYIAYDQDWLNDLEQKLKGSKAYWVAVDIPLDLLEQREAARGTSPAGHARSHYFSVYGDRDYDLRVNTSDHSSEAIAVQLRELISR